MNKINRYILTLTIALISMAAVAQRATVKANIDPATIIMGDLVKLTVEVSEPENAQSVVVLAPELMPGEVEIRPEQWSDTTALGSGMRQVMHTYILQSFDSGLYTIPPVIYVSGTDTLMTNELSLKVNPVDVSEMEDINPMAAPFQGETRWYDALPDWLLDYWGWILVAIILVAGGVCIVLIMTHRLKVPFIPEKKPIPPHDLALMRLETLKGEQLWQKGQEKAYYTELTDILREYLQKRFGINALEMTSRQIMDSLQQNPETRPSKPLMRQILDVADFVKFARMRPVPEDNVRSFNSAMKFVEDTMPKPEPEAEADGDKTAPAPMKGTENNTEKTQIK